MVAPVVRRLAQSAGTLLEGADQVAAAASQISSSSQLPACGATAQAVSIEEMSASSEEINATARKNTEHSGTAAILVAQSQQRFRETNQSLDQTPCAR